MAYRTHRIAVVTRKGSPPVRELAIAELGTVATFSILTPVYRPPAKQFEHCLRSVLRQTSGDWEWVLVDDASGDAQLSDRLRRLAAAEPRVILHIREQNGGIVAASNDALALATGEFVVMLDHDDELEPDALETVAAALREAPDTDYIYSDELAWDKKLGRYIPSFKPAWSLERLRCQNYANHLSVFRRSLVDELGGWRAGFDGAQDHDLVLRVAERARSIRHIPKVLYRWNASPDSTVGNAEAKPYAFENGVRAVQEHADRVGLNADVARADDPGVYRVTRRLETEPKVSVVIPSAAPVGTVFGEERDFLARTVRDLVEATDYKNLEVIVVPDPEVPSDRLAEIVAIDPQRVSCTPAVPRPFNFSRKVNWGAAWSHGDYILLLNDDIEVRHPEWLRNMVGICRQDDVGAVGAKLSFEDGRVQHAGVFIWGWPGHVGFGLAQEDSGYLSMLAVDRECIAVTGACLLTPRAVFEEVGGFYLGLPSNWNDVDYCLKVRAAGKRIVWTPQASLYHFESITRDPRIQDMERDRFNVRWAHEQWSDPYLSPDKPPAGIEWPLGTSR